jgi:pilus assembly protein Flp/PilA
MYNYIRIRLQALRTSERGASAVEYGLLVALIAVIIIVAVTLLGDTLSGIFTDTANAIDSGTTP